MWEMLSKAIKEILMNQICVYSVGPELHEQIHSHFKQFGEIDSIIYRRRSPGCVFVRFKSAASATAATVKNKHQIENKEVDIKAFYNCQQNEMNETEEVCSSFANMDIDGSDEVRVQESSLSRSDLCSIAELCTHFKSNAEQVFSDRFAHVSSMAIWDDKDELKSVFRNFGSFIKSFEFKSSVLISDDDDKEILQFLATYCSGKNSSLESLSLLGVNIEANSNCHKYAKLEKVFLKKMEINSDVLQQFIRLNPQIKSFSMDTITGTDFTRINSSIFRAISTCLTELKELSILHCCVGVSIEESIRDQKKNLHSMACLQHLKKLSIESNLFGNELLDAYAAAEVPIETLHLLRFELTTKSIEIISKLTQVNELHFDKLEMQSDQLVELLRKLPHLNKLNISHSDEFSVKDIVKMIEAAKNLEHLELHHQESLEINKRKFYTILKAVKKRNNGKKLKINIFGDVRDIDVPESVIKQSNAWLEIEVDVDDDDEEDEDEDEDDDEIEIEYVEAGLMHKIKLIRFDFRFFHR